jgi:sRNA-binding carbon storage regulator CsrA
MALILKRRPGESVIIGERFELLVKYIDSSNKVVLCVNDHLDIFADAVTTELERDEYITVLHRMKVSPRVYPPHTEVCLAFSMLNPDDKKISVLRSELLTDSQWDELYSIGEQHES